MGAFSLIVVINLLNRKMENKAGQPNSSKLIKVPRIPRHLQSLPETVSTKTLPSNVVMGKRDETNPKVFQVVPSQKVVTIAAQTSSLNAQSSSGYNFNRSSNITSVLSASSVSGYSNSHVSQKLVGANQQFASSSSQPKVIQADTSAPNKYQYTSASKQLWESIGGKKKSCSCTKSLCLKLYCECFANGEFCFSCSCTNCYNTLENDFECNEAIRAILNRNPNAFHPKVGKVTFSEEKSHYKGCNCKKTNCIKNYCECYEAKILCTSLCKCVDCFNCQERAGLRSIGDVTALRILKEGTIRDMAYYRNEFFDKLPFTLMTTEVIEATVQCMLAQAETAVMSGLSVEESERMIMQEFGQCTNQIIENAPSLKASGSN